MTPGVEDGGTFPVPGIGLLLLPPAEEGVGTCGGDHVCSTWQPRTGIYASAVPEGRSGHALAQYRWLLGHHVAFGVWALLTSTLQEAGHHPHRTAERCESLFDAYSAVLRYAGSCIPATYATAIRPAMAAAGLTFSGRCASGFTGVDELLAGLPDDVRCDPRLVAARRRNARTHQDVGRRVLSAQPELPHTMERMHAPTASAQRERFERIFRIGADGSAHHGAEPDALEPPAHGQATSSPIAMSPSRYTG